MVWRIVSFLLCQLAGGLIGGFVVSQAAWLTGALAGVIVGGLCWFLIDLLERFGCVQCHQLRLRDSELDLVPVLAGCILDPLQGGSGLGKLLAGRAGPDRIPGARHSDRPIERARRTPQAVTAHQLLDL